RDARARARRAREGVRGSHSRPGRHAVGGGAQARAAERDLAVRGAGHGGSVPGHSHRGVAFLPGAVRPAAHAVVGQHAQRGPHLSRDRAVDLRVPGHRDHAHRPRLQSAGGRAARRPRPERAVTSSMEEPIMSKENPLNLSRRQVLKAGGLTLGALAVGRRAAAQTPKPGGTLISAQATEATGLDPQLVPALSRSRRSPMMYSQLVRFDESMTPNPELAESWETNKDGLTWTFKLRQGVKFHDGQELTSADVKFTFDRLFEKSPGKSDFIAVDKVEPAGKYGVKFVTKEPFAGLLAALGGFWGFIISEAGIKKHGDLNKAALGTGPFMLEDWKVEQQLTLKKNPYYWKKGLPYVDELVLRVIPDEANIVAALRTGQIHHAFIEDNKNYNLLKDEKTLTGYRSSRLGYDYLNITATRGPLKDVRVRQAISWAVDRNQVLRVAAAGFGRLTAPATAPMKQWQLPEEAWMKYYKPDVEKAKK